MVAIDDKGQGSVGVRTRDTAMYRNTKGDSVVLIHVRDGDDSITVVCFIRHLWRKPIVLRVSQPLVRYAC